MRGFIVYMSKNVASIMFPALSIKHGTSYLTLSLCGESEELSDIRYGYDLAIERQLDTTREARPCNMRLDQKKGDFQHKIKGFLVIIEQHGTVKACKNKQ